MINSWNSKMKTQVAYKYAQIIFQIMQFNVRDFSLEYEVKYWDTSKISTNLTNNQQIYAEGVFAYLFVMPRTKF